MMITVSRYMKGDSLPEPRSRPNTAIAISAQPQMDRKRDLLRATIGGVDGTFWLAGASCVEWEARAGSRSPSGTPAGGSTAFPQLTQNMLLPGISLPHCPQN